jgi:chromosome segregation ATPase
MDENINKKINCFKISLNYLKNYDNDLKNNIKKINDEIFLLKTKLNNNNVNLNELTTRKNTVNDELLKGKLLLETLEKNNKILDKLYNL